MTKFKKTVSLRKHEDLKALVSQTLSQIKGLKIQTTEDNKHPFVSQDIIAHIPRKGTYQNTQVAELRKLFKDAFAEAGYTLTHRSEKGKSWWNFAGDTKNVRIYAGVLEGPKKDSLHIEVRNSVAKPAAKKADVEQKQAA